MNAPDRRPAPEALGFDRGGRQWLLSRLYYCVDSRRHDADVRGDAIVQALHGPLIDALHRALPEAIVTWMRFCAEGYHLRLQVFDRADRIAGTAQPLVQARVERFVQDRSDLFEGTMWLPPAAAQVSHRFAQGRALLPAGTHHCAPVADAGDGPCYDSFAQFACVQQLLMHEARHSLRVLGLHGRYQARLDFWRAYADHVLRVLGLGAAQQAAAWQHLVQTWQRHFQLDEAALAARELQLAARAPLPGSLLRALQALAEAQHTVDRQAFRAAPGGGRWLQQVLALLHLCANRLGLAIADEVVHARLALRPLQATAGDAHAIA